MVILCLVVTMCATGIRQYRNIQSAYRLLSFFLAKNTKMQRLIDHPPDLPYFLSSSVNRNIHNNPPRDYHAHHKVKLTYLKNQPHHRHKIHYPAQKSLKGCIINSIICIYLGCKTSSYLTFRVISTLVFFNFLISFNIIY